MVVRSGGHLDGDSKEQQRVHKLLEQDLWKWLGSFCSFLPNCYVIQRIPKAPVDRRTAADDIVQSASPSMRVEAPVASLLHEFYTTGGIAATGPWQLLLCCSQHTSACCLLPSCHSLGVQLFRCQWLQDN